MRAEHAYVHVPFCARRCVYCDFSIAVRQRVPVDEYLGALDREWTSRHRDSTLDLATLYFGGGTPSKLGPHGVARLMDLARRHARLRDDAEVTLEANPEDVSPESAVAWRSAGVNRVSLGVQSFDDEALRWMHRTHDAAGAERAIKVLQDVGLDNLSIDLIFATPDVVHRRWRPDVEKALEFGLPHISVYGLTVESHTPLGRRVARRDEVEAPEEAFELEFLTAHETLVASGLEHYEVSNYGMPARHSRHNWAYWDRRPYAGLGPSAHEFDGRARRWNTAPYADWVARTEGASDPRDGCEVLTEAQSLEESVYLNLRTTHGVTVLADERAHVVPWIEAGWAKMTGDVLRLTAAGWLRLDAIAGALTLVRSR